MISLDASLVLCAHGSPRASWRLAMDALMVELSSDEALNQRYPGGVTCAFLEHDEPRLVARTREALERGLSVDVLPIFLSPGRHQRDDLPRLLGLAPSSNDGEDVLAPTPRVRLLPPPQWGKVLETSLVRRAGERLPDSERAAALLVHYGSTLEPCPWSPLAAQMGEALSRSGIQETRHLGAGHHRPNPAQEIAAELNRMLSMGVNVAVVPLLLARSGIQEDIIPAAIAHLPANLQERVGWIPDAILPDPEVHAAIAAHALRVASGA